jgi:hypothetical protein
MADEPEGLGVVISAREIYDEIVGMREDVRSLSQTSHSTDETLDDHENRLRSIERWKYALPLTALAAVGSAAATFYQNK